MANYEEAKRKGSEYATALEEKSIAEEAEARRKENEEAFDRNLAKFDESVVKIRLEYDAKLEEYKKVLAKWESDLQKRTEEESRFKANFLARQAENNGLISELKTNWEMGDANAIVDHASLVLKESNYDGLFQSRFDLFFQPVDGVLLVEFELPSPDNLPTLKTVRSVAETGELKQTHISDREKRDLYDDVCYQICLRTIHEILSADTSKHIASVVFNGTAEYVGRASGNNVRATIMSLMVSRADFTSLNLKRIDPKACFKSLKGVSAASLSGLAAIPPVMRMDRNDRRFIEGRNVELDDGGETNLASMSWEDFEHLVRELFEKEFATRGGEVKVTQSSRDGGVDAVAFDPDPITGGKIVIQAKRYTQTVGVGAVRDLYGTTLSEGASKGILVTTADYGPDAYKFAIGKPLTLLTGSNLLHLLEKHGVRAKIDLRAARIEAGLSGTKEM